MKRIQVLDKGWVQLEECMGGDAAVMGAARICCQSWARACLEQAGIERVPWNREGAD